MNEMKEMRNVNEGMKKWLALAMLGRKAFGSSCNISSFLHLHSSFLISHFSFHVC